MLRPQFEELGIQLQAPLDPSKAKLFPLIARGAAPLSGPVLISCWVYFLLGEESELKAAAEKSLSEYPEKMLTPLLQGELEPWVLDFLGQRFTHKESFLEMILLNAAAPNGLFVEVAKSCSERMANMIANNQERVIESPEIVVSLESNKHNLKSNTDRLRHFLKLAGIHIPGSGPSLEELESTVQAPTAASVPQADESLEAPPTEENVVEESLNPKRRTSLVQYIYTLSTGARVKLAFKGNKEARNILIRDTNKLVALAVLRSPRITENEVAFYAALRNVSEDVIRVIAQSVTFTKGYQVKYNLCLHPKTPLQNSMVFIKFLSLRDLTRVSREKNIPGPIQKASKELLKTKRK